MSKPEPDSETTRVARAYVQSLEGLICVDGGPPSLTSQRSGNAARRMPTPRPALAGCRLTRSAHDDVYVVDRDGYRRLIPDGSTYGRLFRDSNGIRTTSVDSIAMGPPIGAHTVLVRGDQSDRTFIIDQGCLRLISGPAIMDKYWFAWERIVRMDQAVLDCLVSGPAWE